MKCIENGKLPDPVDERERRRARRKELSEWIRENPLRIECQCGVVLLVDDYENDLCRNSISTIPLAEHSFLLDKSAGMMPSEVRCKCGQVHGVHTSRPREGVEFRAAYVGPLVAVVDSSGWTGYATKAKAEEVDRIAEGMRKTGRGYGV